MTETAERGAEAYRQAYRHIEAGGLCRTPWGRRRAAMRYLRFTASPPLTLAEQEAAADAMRRMRGMTRRDWVILAVVVVIVFAAAIAIAHSPMGSWERHAGLRDAALQGRVPEERGWPSEAAEGAGVALSAS